MMTLFANLFMGCWTSSQRARIMFRPPLAANVDPNGLHKKGGSDMSELIDMASQFKGLPMADLIDRRLGRLRCASEMAWRPPISLKRSVFSRQTRIN